MTKPAETESPKSAFVQEMEAAIAKRLAAAGWPDKSAVDREIRDIIRRHLGRDAWQAMVDAGEDVPHETSRDRKCHGSALGRRASVRSGGTGRYSERFDHKLAQAGERDDD